MVYPNSPFDTPNADLDTPRTASAPNTNGREAMAYMDAFSSFFKLEGWGKSLGFLALCSLIPIVGVIVMIGFFATQFVRQHYNGDEDRMEFAFDRFGDYLGRGVWWFLMAFIITFAMIPIYALYFGAIAISANISETMAAIVAAGGGLLFLVVMFGLGFLAQPMLLKAMLTQQIGGAFDFALAKDFVSKMWLEMLLGGLFIMGISIPLIMLGYLACGIGLYAAIPLQYWTIFQVQRQLYEVYLFRGGTPIEISEQLVPE